MRKNIYYSIVLNDEQLAFIGGSKYGIDRTKILTLLIQGAVTEETIINKRGFATTLQIGQVLMSEVELASKVSYDKKTISRVLDKMVQLGIISSDQNNRTSIHILHCVSAWYVDGKLIRNPHYVSMEQRHEYSLVPGNYNNERMNKTAKDSGKESTSSTNSLDSKDFPTKQTDLSHQAKDTAQYHSSSPIFGENHISGNEKNSICEHSESTSITTNIESNAVGSADNVSTKHSYSDGNIPNKDNDISTIIEVSDNTNDIEIEAASKLNAKSSSCILPQH